MIKQENYQAVCFVDPRDAQKQKIIIAQCWHCSQMCFVLRLGCCER